MWMELSRVMSSSRELENTVVPSLRMRPALVYKAAISTMAAARTAVEVRKPREARRKEEAGVVCATSVVMRVPVRSSSSLPEDQPHSCHSKSTGRRLPSGGLPKRFAEKGWIFCRGALVRTTFLCIKPGLT